MTDAPLALADALPVAELAAQYARAGRVQVREVLLERSAQRIHAALVAQRQWNLVLQRDGRHQDMDFEAVAGWSAADRSRLEQLVREGARDGFQYHYANIPLYDVWHGQLLPGHLFEDVFRFLNSPAFLGLARTITGEHGIAFADAQLTRFGPGHFLTRHDDDVAGKHRRAAYVLNLTPSWRMDWGGILQFTDADGDVSGGYTPRWNALNLFRVPQPHSVSLVTPFAGAERFAITGWLRSGADPGPRAID